MASSSNDDYRQDFTTYFLNKDMAKRDFLLGFLQPFMNNIVDNLTTKDSLSFASTKQHLLDLCTTPSSTKVDSALFTSNKNSNKRSKTSGFKLDNTTQESTWCAKHHPGRHRGHVFTECYKLKAKQKDDKSKKRHIWLILIKMKVQTKVHVSLTAEQLLT